MKCMCINVKNKGEVQQTAKMPDKVFIYLFTANFDITSLLFFQTKLHFSDIFSVHISTVQK